MLTRFCECETAGQGARGYERCDAEASRISHAGWFMCERHASVADTHFGTTEAGIRLARRERYGASATLLTGDAIGLGDAETRLLGF